MDETTFWNGWNTLTAISVAATAIIAWWQLGGVKKALKFNALAAVLDMECEMHRRKEKLDQNAIALRRAVIDSGGEPLSQSLLVLFDDERECALEGYLNSIDRLAYCINKGLLKDRDWQKEYDEFLAETVRENQDKFGPGTRYINIYDLHNKWRRS